MQTATLNDRYDIEELYAYEDTTEERIANLHDKSIIRYRTKTIKSGNILECEIYPIWKTHASLTRAKKFKESRETQKNLNKKNAVKKVIRLVNANFTDDDIWGTFTYETKRLPKSIEEAQKEMSKFIRRLKYYAKKHEYPELKYVYVTEFEDDPEKGKKRVHHHIVTNFPDRDIAENLWRNGARRQTRRLQADESGYEGLVRYIMKDPKGAKRYVCSKNLKQPQVTIADYKFTKKKVNDLALGNTDKITVFENLYTGYEMTHFTSKTSEYVSGTYLYVKMIKTIDNSKKQSEQKRKKYKNCS